MLRRTGTTPSSAGGQNNDAFTSGLGHTTVGGGLDNAALGEYGTVVGGRANNASSRSTILGGFGHQSTGGTATVAGGSRNRAWDSHVTVVGGASNTALEPYATVLGGYGNTAYEDCATVGGGKNNKAMAPEATISGGVDNYASGTSSTIVGGRSNTAWGSGATVAGGYENRASALQSTVVGGHSNTAERPYSFAAGRRASAVADGVFVWGDSENTNVKSGRGLNEFNVFASGGVRLFSGDLNLPVVFGVQLTSGSGTWSFLSDRDSKRDFAPVSGDWILDRLRTLPIATWNYRSQPDSVRHLGPMAQDFHAAFGLGTSERRIDAVDADGVGLAAAKAVYERLNELADELSLVRAQLASRDERGVR